VQVENAIIESADMEIEDHGILTCSVLCRFDQRIGTQGLPCYGPPGLLMFVVGVLRVTNQSRLQGVVGKRIRVRRDNGSNRISAIGHIVDDDWFVFDDEIK
jgi:hypothetical protein